MMAGAMPGAAMCTTSSISPRVSTQISSSAVLSTSSALRLRFQTLSSRDGRKDVAIVVSAAVDDKAMSRREVMSFSAASLGAFLIVSGFSSVEGVTAAEFTDTQGVIAAGFTDIMNSMLLSRDVYACFVNPVPALRGKDYGKSKMSYPDYVQTESGLQYKDLREGVGSNPHEGDLVVIDWAGYTIGYYGRIFEARNKAKGGSFEGNEKGYFKFRLGEDQVIPAFEEAIKTMRVGGVRRIIVPADLGYPNNDYNTKGPQPATFSGQRALDFVLKNQGLIDKTLLFDIELLKVVEK